MVKDKLADAADRLGQSLDAPDFETELQGRMLEMREGLEKEIREHPLKSLAIALGCGFLLAKLLD